MGKPALPNEIGGLSAEAHRPALRLRLYVARSTPNSVRAEQNLAMALKELCEGNFELTLEVFDVFTHPKPALTDRIMVTPTLISMGPSGRNTMIGDLSDSAKLRTFLQNL